MQEGMTLLRKKEKKIVWDESVLCYIVGSHRSTCVLYLLWQVKKIYRIVYKETHANVDFHSDNRATSLQIDHIKAETDVAC